MSASDDASIELLDVVALMENLPVHGLHRGQIGTVVKRLPPDTCEIKFIDGSGRTLAQLPLQGSQFVVVRGLTRTLPDLTVDEAIAAADALLPGEPVENEKLSDPRWQAIILVGEHMDREPEKVWSFVQRWGRNQQQDLQAALGTCLLEHLLEDQFDLIFPKVKAAVERDPAYMGVLRYCSHLARRSDGPNATQIARLLSLHDR